MSNIVEINELYKSYGTIQVLKDVNLNIQEGETYALLGVNGAGKTTTLECLEGIRKIDRGNIIVSGYDVSKDINEVQKVMGVQLQSTSLPDQITPNEAMSLFCAWHKVEFREDLLVRFGMRDYLNKSYHTLSTGRKRRLHLALALCHRPKILILDEPTAGLDVEGRRSLHNEIRQLKKENVTIIMATHDMTEAENLCDRIGILRDGKIIIEGTPLEITSRSTIHSQILIKTRNASLLAKNFNDTQKKLDDGYMSYATNDVSNFLIKLLQFVNEANDDVLDLRVERASLEDIFISIAGGK